MLTLCCRQKPYRAFGARWNKFVQVKYTAVALKDYAQQKHEIEFRFARILPKKTTATLASISTRSGHIHMRQHIWFHPHRAKYLTHQPYVAIVNSVSPL